MHFLHGLVKHRPLSQGVILEMTFPAAAILEQENVPGTRLGREKQKARVILAH